MMTVRNAVTEGVRVLKGSAETPFLDAVLLLAKATGSSKEQLFARYSDALPEKSQEVFFDLLQRRRSGIPVSYLRGEKEFYSLRFEVDQRVLVPRPDTETLVDAALALTRNMEGTPEVHDCCTGSGCVAISLKHSSPRLSVSASDVSCEAIEVFAINSMRILGSVLRSYESDLLASVPGAFDLVTANPPYLNATEMANLRESGWPEPRIALDGGEDGLDIYRRLIPQAMSKLKPGGYLLLEADSRQMVSLAKMLVQNTLGEIILYKDFGGRDRVIQGRR